MVIAQEEKKKKKSAVPNHTLRIIEGGERYYKDRPGPVREPASPVGMEPTKEPQEPFPPEMFNMEELVAEGLRVVSEDPELSKIQKNMAENVKKYFSGDQLDLSSPEKKRAVLMDEAGKWSEKIKETSHEIRMRNLPTDLLGVLFSAGSFALGRPELLLAGNFLLERGQAKFKDELSPYLKARDEALDNLIGDTAGQERTQFQKYLAIQDMWRNLPIAERTDENLEKMAASMGLDPATVELLRGTMVGVATEKEKFLEGEAGAKTKALKGAELKAEDELEKSIATWHRKNRHRLVGKGETSVKSWAEEGTVEGISGLLRGAETPMSSDEYIDLIIKDEGVRSNLINTGVDPDTPEGRKAIMDLLNKVSGEKDSGARKDNSLPPSMWKT